jgi:hypothetical protein
LSKTSNLALQRTSVTGLFHWLPPVPSNHPMPHDIRPTVEADLPELSRFLIEGFHAPTDAPFAAVDVLGWKYFDPLGDEAGETPRSYIGIDPETRRIVGHLGVCPSRFHGREFGLPPDGVSTLHMIDWLSAKNAVGVGARLMRRAHQATTVQYGFGGSVAGRTVGGRGGYAVVANVPVYHRVLRPLHRLSEPGHGWGGRAARALWDAAGIARRPPKRPKTPIELERVTTFGEEVAPILERYESRAIFTSRSAGALNHALRYPRGGLTGWRVHRVGVLRGFAMLTVVPPEHPNAPRIGRITECLLDDPDLWPPAIHALTSELKRQGADRAMAVGSTDWARRGLSDSGYFLAHDVEFRLRDRRNIIPRDAVFHFTPMEADYAYS